MRNKPVRLVQPGSRNLLARILDQPDLPAQVQSLPPIVLGKLIDRVGLEDAGELVALATTEQLAHVFDDDLWNNEHPGEQERFDASRFLVWLEVMLEAGEGFVARRLAELPEDLVTLALSRHVLVLELDELALQMQSADEVEARQLDKALESCLYEEVGTYQVMARNPDGWDTILSVILALDRDHHHLLDRILSCCAGMASEYIEDNGGLYEVLTSDDMLEADVAGDREDRRAAQGHVAPSLAKGFLSLARNGADESLGEHDAVTRAYFRDLASPSTQPKGGRAKAPPPTVARVDDSLLEILEDAGVAVFAQSERLLTSPQGVGSLGESLLMRAMQSLQETDPKAFSGRSEELAYLTNVLVSGCSMRGRKMRPVEAIRAVMATCNLGLALSMPRGGKVGTSASLEKARTLLTTVPADGLFRLAWHRIHGDVVDQAANAAEVLLDRAMSQAPAEDKDVFARDLSAIRTHRSAGTPWEAMSALDCLAGAVEPAAIDSLAGLMDQCPTLPDEAPAASSKNGTARGEQPLRFISTLEELAAATRFLSWLEEAPAPSAAPAEPPRKPAKRKTARRK